MAILAQLYFTPQTISGTQYFGKVLIRLTDTVTGSPINGGPTFEVSYDQNINGSISSNTVLVPGQSLEIYNGEIKDTSDTTPFFTQFTITGYDDGSGGDTPPPVGVCDLLINNIIINNPESGIGAEDASITVNANSTYGPITYSLDNVTFQDSPTFTGLTGGLKTVYVKDTNPVGCASNKSVTIPITTNLLQSDPSVALGSNHSRWNAAFNPIVFTYQRKDFEITAASLYNVLDVSGLFNIMGTTLAVNGDMSVIQALAAANVIAGANAVPIYVYVSTWVYKGVYQVITADVSSVTIKTPYTATAVGFMNSNDIKPYYKMITNITYVDPVTGISTTIQSLNTPDGTGLIKADLSSFLQSLVKPVSKSLYDQINFRDDNLSASYRIAYAESWDDGTDAGHTSPFVQLSPTYYVTYTARQLGQKYGGNMAEFVPFRNLPANWLTPFVNPVYSLTFPFDLSFIYSEDLAGLPLYYKLTPLDINKQPLSGGIVQGFLLNEDGSFLLNTDGSRFIISETNLDSVPIVEHVGLNRLLISESFDSEVYYFKIGIYYDNSGDTGHVDMELHEALTPDFIDGNAKVVLNGVETDIIHDGDTFSTDSIAGNTYEFVAESLEVPTGPNPKLRMTITKGATTIFDQQVAITGPVTLTKSGIIQPGGNYKSVVRTLSTTTPVTPIDIADDNPVTKTTVQILNDLIARVDKDCDYNSVYLRWVDLTGAWCYYRFIYNQEVSLDVQNSTVISRYVQNWETDETIEDVIVKAAGQKMTVHTEGMSVDDIKGCQAMKFSPKVQMLVSKSPIKWQTIVLNTATFAEYETNLNTYEFAVTFNLPSVNVQTQ